MQSSQEMEPTSRAPGRESLDISPCQALQSGDLGVKRPWVSVFPQGTCRRARATFPIFSRGPPIRAESHRCAPLLQGLTPLTTTCIGGPKCGPCYGVAGTWQAMDSSACMSETKDRHFVAPESPPYGHGLLVVYQEGWHEAGPCHDTRGAGGTEPGFVASLCKACGPAQLEGSLLLFCPSKIPVGGYLS